MANRPEPAIPPSHFPGFEPGLPSIPPTNPITPPIGGLPDDGENDWITPVDPGRTPIGEEPDEGGNWDDGGNAWLIGSEDVSQQRTIEFLFRASGPGFHPFLYADGTRGNSFSIRALGDRLVIKLDCPEASPFLVPSKIPTRQLSPRPMRRSWRNLQKKAQSMTSIKRKAPIMLPTLTSKHPTWTILRWNVSYGQENIHSA